MKKDERHRDHQEPGKAVDEQARPGQPGEAQAQAPDQEQAQAQARAGERPRAQDEAGEQNPAQFEAHHSSDGRNLPARRESHSQTESEKQLSPELELVEKMRAVATSPQLQAFWKALLPHLGVLPSQSGEFPGMFRVESEPGESEATVYIDIPNRPYERGVPSELDRVLALKISLDHDFRRLGDRHYCVDCEVPGSETRH